ncbi:hypothetical protein DENSPDRAFT_629915 [Dentipellis sp. KUC8613]|nr:hypothetical protein DENSPDRAFT_629915 [Dentipellis sp. KUC8613]
MAPNRPDMAPNRSVLTVTTPRKLTSEPTEPFGAVLLLGPAIASAGSLTRRLGRTSASASTQCRCRRQLSSTADVPCPYGLRVRAMVPALILLPALLFLSRTDEREFCRRVLVYGGGGVVAVVVAVTDEYQGLQPSTAAPQIYVPVFSCPSFEDSIHPH